MLITSTENVKIVEVTKLHDKKYRDRTGNYLLEGVRLVSDAFKYGANISDVFVSESAANCHSFAGQTLVSDKVFSKICGTVNSQGVLAVARKPQQELTAPLGNCLVFDGLQDPGNAGTLIRTAAACGFSDVYAANSVDLYSPKVLRSAMSAHFCVKLHEAGLEQIFQCLQNVTAIAADMHGQNLFETRFDGNVALVLGNEGNGLSDFSRRRVRQTVSLPMANEFESLNVAVAGSVIAYWIFSQNI